MIFLFGRKKPEASSNSALEPPMVSRLQELCGGDEELYRALSNLMFLDPKKIMLPFETILNEAMEFEMKGNTIRAEVGYRIAGGISLYKGDRDGVKNYFTKASSLASDSLAEYNTLAKRPDEAVSVAQKYYQGSDT